MGNLIESWVVILATCLVHDVIETESKREWQSTSLVYPYTIHQSNENNIACSMWWWNKMKRGWYQHSTRLQGAAPSPVLHCHTEYVLDDIFFCWMKNIVCFYPECYALQPRARCFSRSRIQTAAFWCLCACVSASERYYPVDRAYARSKKEQRILDWACVLRSIALFSTLQNKPIFLNTFLVRHSGVLCTVCCVLCSKQIENVHMFSYYPWLLSLSPRSTNMLVMLFCCLYPVVLYVLVGWLVGWIDGWQCGSGDGSAAAA